MWVDACKPSTQKTEAEGSLQAQGYSGKYTEIGEVLWHHYNLFQGIIKESWIKNHLKN